MHQRRKVPVTLLITAMTVGVVQAGSMATAAATTMNASAVPGINAAAPARRHTVTLVTGDRVSVNAAGATGGVVTPGKGREHLSFATFHAAGHLYVVPQDAQRLIRAGMVDRRLFDISGLINLGYDDERRGTLPLLVRYTAAAATENARPMPAVGGARVTRELSAINGAALELDKANPASLWSTVTAGAAGIRGDAAAGIGRIWLDGKRKPALDQSVPQVGAPAAWQAGLTGKGVTVAVLDTGIDATHPDLAGKVVEAQNFTEESGTGDEVGHGTHVASTIAGTGAASGGRYKGVAPEADLLIGKVCGRDGWCLDSAILAGMQWAAVVKHAKAVNMSLGDDDTPDLDPIEEAVNTLTAQTGALFVVAAGNDGATVASPGSADAALTVGAVDKENRLAPFSGRGPRTGDDAVKPDLTAPGVDIIAARAADTQLGDPVGDSYVRLPGTSMATPHVTGAVALLAQQHPDWSAAGYKATLTASATPAPAITGFQQGAGRLDAARAIAQTLTSDPVSVSFGRQLWPHGDDKPITRTIRYHNSGAVEATLNLTVRAYGPDPATPPPAGLFTLSTARVTVPAGGTASVDVTADTAAGGADGLYSGQLLATGGPVQASTALGINKESESYNLTLVHIDRDAATTGDYSTQLTELDTLASTTPYSDTGVVTVRLPRGRYDLFTFLHTPTGPGTASTSLLAQPVVDLTSDRTITLDARTAGEVRATVPEATAIPLLADAGYDHILPNGISVGATLLRYDKFDGSAFDGMYLGHVGAKLPGTEYIARIGSQWTKRTANGGYDASAYWYATGAYQYGQLPAGFIRHYRKSEFAEVSSEHAAAAPGSIGQKVIMPWYPTGVSGWAQVVNVPLPFTRPEYINTDRGLRWGQWLDVGTVDADDIFDITSRLLGAPPRTYQPGRRYCDRWNDGPFGPALPMPEFDSDFVTRQADTILVYVPLFSDRSGHAGDAVTDGGSTTLYRNGILVERQQDAGIGLFEVPPEPATYRLVVDATRSGYTDLTTSLHAEWTFRSGHTPPDTYTRLPLSVVRFTPELTGNAAPAGRSFEIPVTTQTQNSSTAGPARLLTVEVSYDDGNTWRPAGLRTSGNDWVATVTHPNSAGYVSLRARAVDPAGNQTEQTLIRAYRLTA